MNADTSPVIYSLDDYASCLRRVASCIVDLMVLALIFAGTQLWFAYKYVPPEVRAMASSPAQQQLSNKYLAPVAGQISLLSLGVVAIYIIPVRQLRGGSIGYRLLGLRLVDATGNPPNLGPLLKRAIVIGILMFIGLMPAGMLTALSKGMGPTAKGAVMLAGIVLFVFMAYRPCLTHVRRQSVHDRWSGTWMIRKRAAAIGRADVKFHTVFFGTWPIRYVELEPAAPPDPLPDTTPSARPFVNIDTP
jgi:uncharacterized RDD family membrane protein YckC